MKFIISRFTFLCGCFLITSMGACRKPEIKTYTIPKGDYSESVIAHMQRPKDPPPSVAPTPPPAGNSAPSMGTPQVTWTLPTGWEDRTRPGAPGDFVVTEGESAVSISILLFPKQAGNFLDIANVMAEEFDQEPYTEDSLAQRAEQKVFGERQANILAFEGTIDEPPAGLTSDVARVVLALLESPDDEFLLFVRMLGDPAAVNNQRSNFDALLSSIDVSEPAPGASSDPSATPKWSVPVTWTEKDPGSMRRASFGVDREGKTADIAVTVFEGSVGGLLDNVNRWRDQLGMAATTEANLADMVQAITIDEKQGTLVEIAHEGQATKVAMVPHAGNTWFFKMTGDEALVEEERANLIAFVTSIEF